MAAIGLLAVAGTASLAGCSGGSDSTNIAVDYYPVGHQSTVGNIAGTTLTGSHLALSSMRGKYVVVNFWASNCSPCRAEQTTMNEVARAEKPNNVEFVGIDVRDTRDNAVSFLRIHPATYPSFFDPNGVLTLDFPNAEPATTPTTIVLTPQGRIAARINGSTVFTELRTVVNKVRGEAA